ncbi:MAG: hypothetical protein JAY99_19735 [Candidatus Thiodiazotropha lotti]|nr:hypothetical protein [Candidatus Thiodiazotropha lotti]MCW4193525.1 hypothetical protein [Candidatus Thiodiazotropha weberae]
MTTFQDIHQQRIAPFDQFQQDLGIDAFARRRLIWQRPAIVCDSIPRFGEELRQIPGETLEWQQQRNQYQEAEQP